MNSESGELIEAFQAQKLVNRQLESELTALTEENNAKLEDLYHQIDTLRNERDALQNVMLDEIDDDETEKSVIHFRNRERYLKYELEKASESNAEIMEKYNNAMRQLTDLKKKNSLLMNRLRDHGLKDDILLSDEMQSVHVTKKKSQVYQGIFKYRYEDESKLLARLISDLKPRVAITLLPGLPAYIIFMCIRYLDLLNTDDHVVRTLLSNFVTRVKKIFKQPNVSECRILWLVNTLT